MIDNLKFLQYNIRGLYMKERQLVDLATNNRVNVMILNEVKQSNYCDLSTSFQLHGWDMYKESYRCVVCVQNTLNAQVDHITLGLKDPIDKAPHATAIRIKTRGGNEVNQLLIVAVYLSPKVKEEDLLRVFEEVGKVKEPEEHVIVAGDINAHHVDFGSDRTDKKGKMLKEFLKTAPYKMMNTGDQTYGSSVLDMTFSSLTAMELVTEWKVLRNQRLAHFSDHWPITFKYTTPHKFKPVTRWNWYLKADDKAWENFVTATTMDVKYNRRLDAEQNAYQITKAIVSAALETISMVKRTPKEHPWWTRRMSKLKRMKKNLQRKLTPRLKERDPEKFEEIKELWADHKKRLDEVIKKGDNLKLIGKRNNATGADAKIAFNCYECKIRLKN